MSSRHSYELSEISSAASGHRLSRTVSRDSPPSRYPAPISNHASKIGNPYSPSQKHDPASPALLSNEKVPRPRLNFYDQSFTNGCGWELLAWLLAAASLLAFIAIFAGFSNKPLGDWHSRLAPNTIVSVLSQIGQTAVLVPVTSCLCKFYSLSVDNILGLRHVFVLNFMKTCSRPTARRHADSGFIKANLCGYGWARKTASQIGKARMAKNLGLSTCKHTPMAAVILLVVGFYSGNTLDSKSRIACLEDE